MEASSKETEKETVPRLDLSWRRELLRWTRRAAAQRLIAGSMFSFSRRTGEDSFLINPCGMGACEMETTDLVGLQAGRAEPGKTPEALWRIHRHIYLEHPEISAILLNYPEAMMGLACSDAELEPRSMPEIYMMLRTLPHLSLQEYLEDPGSLSRILGKTAPVTYVQNAFVISTADRLQTAFDRMEVAESAAQATAAAGLFGEVAPLPEEEVRKIEEVFHLK